MKPFQIYRSSAGSGKTRTLAKFFLKLALENKTDYFRHILAVTFANKATAEMKGRIVEYLSKFSTGKEESLAAELQEELGLDSREFSQRSKRVLTALLHHYSDFNITTIDAFFQRIIRAFAREAGLAGDYRVELNTQEAMKDVVDELMKKLRENEKLRHWVMEFSLQNLEEKSKWNIKGDIRRFANEMFQESYLAIPAKGAPDLKKLREEKHKEAKQFMNFLRAKAEKAHRMIAEKGWTNDDFKWKNSGAHKFFENFVREWKQPSDIKIGERHRGEFLSADNWANAKSPYRNDIAHVADELAGTLQEMLDYFDKHIENAISAELLLENFYSLALMSFMAGQLAEYKQEENIMLLAEANHFLKQFISDSDAPFIYEKTGSFFRHFLIDEFQDTSKLQWNNFLPLIKNSLGSACSSLAVGDVKQGIYRWRGSDMDLFQHKALEDVGEYRSDINVLKKNFRSARNVVEFNNAFFVALRQHTDFSAETRQAYQEAEQEVEKKMEGCVRVTIFEEDKAEGAETVQEKSLNWMLRQIQELLENNIPQKDIAILVRKNNEGTAAANFLLRQKSSKEDFRVISNEALFISSSNAVKALVSAMKLLINNKNTLAKAELQTALHALNGEEPKHDWFAQNIIPPEFYAQSAAFLKLPLYELTEALIQLFKLSDFREHSFLQAFLQWAWDLGNRQNDLFSFLQWWEEEGSGKAIEVSEDADAIRIITIHKSKGLQFPYVIIPFCNWKKRHAKVNFNFWVSYATEEYAMPAPVKYSKTLDRSHWKNEYEEELRKAAMDNLNLLYVAFTRAANGLFIAAKKDKNTVGDWIESSLTAQEKWNEKEYAVGTVSRQPQQPKEATKMAHSLPAFQWRDKISIQRNGHAFFSDGHQSKVAEGIILHRVLAQVKYASDWPVVFNSSLSQGLFSAEEGEKLRQEWERLMELPTAASWFAPEWTVHTEVPLLAPPDKAYRADRLLIRGDKAVVIDFKTGKQKKEDKEQVKHYQELIAQMGYEAEGYVLYLRSAVIEKI